MDRHEDLRTFIRDACRRRGVSLGEASLAMGKSRNWLERLVNYDSETGAGIKRPRVESCKTIARYFNEDPNRVLQMAGYISPPVSSTPLVDECSTIASLLPHEDQLALLEYARLLKFRNDARDTLVTFPSVPGIDWKQLRPQFAKELALFIQEEPKTTHIWIEALNALPEQAVELLLLNAKNQMVLRDKFTREQVTKTLTQLARIL
jgi:hypothetical protein